MHWKVFAGIVAALGIGAVLYLAVISTAPASNGIQPPAACPADAKLCPDGSAVGRTGPNCEFSECPVAQVPLQNASTTAQSFLVTARIGERVEGLDVALTPLSVASDSRCPADPKVQCVWAGTVQVQIRIESGLGTSTMTLELGKSITTEAEEIALTEVTPTKLPEKEMLPGEYRFTFEIKKR
jgi:hypothetical protein